MKTEMFTPLTEAPPPHTGWHDFRLLLINQLRVTWNKICHWPIAAWIGMIVLGAGSLGLLIYLGFIAYGTLELMPLKIARGFLTLLFMVGLAGQLFFGVTAAFTTLYMSEDLELLFMAPVSTRVVFAVKSMVVTASNFFPAVLFILLPGVFYGLLFGAPIVYYLPVVLVFLGMLVISIALAELLNLIVMRIVPPHRSREAVGFIAALGGIMLALVFQLPNIMMSRGNQLDLTGWLAGQQQMLRVMDYFPWGWGSLALTESAAGNMLVALSWVLLLLALAVVVFVLAFALVERGFRRGWVSLSQGGGGRIHKRKQPASVNCDRHPAQVILPITTAEAEAEAVSSPWPGMWAVTKKDLLYMIRDTREWFGYMVPLIIMAFFVAQFLLLPVNTTRSSLVSILIMYTIMFSGNIALQSFGREGEAGWVMNSVPMAGWPVVWGKLMASVIPTLVLMEALLAGTAVAIGLSFAATAGLAAAAVFITLGSSAIGLFYSINNCRFNPDSPQQRIAPGASMLMYLVNLLFIVVLAPGLLYIFPPAELLAVLRELPVPSFSFGFPDILVYALYLLSRPLMWPPLMRILAGVIAAGGVWSAVFFGFMAATVKQSRKGFRVEIVTGGKKKPKQKALLKKRLS